jgi:hypothetical protein
MEVFCTYCSKPKDESEEEMPAVYRYKSKRIKAVYESSKILALPFYILSGEFGLISGLEPIPFYDHLLIAEEVISLSKKIEKQIVEADINKIVFFINSYYKDANIFTYISTLYLACEMTSTDLLVINIELCD